MYFADLKYNCQQRRDGQSDKVENKQRMNISDHAYLVLQNDMAVFQPQNIQGDPERISSGLINQIFRNFRQKAGSSIACALHNKEIEYGDLFRNLGTEERKKVLSLLTGDYEKKLLADAKRRLEEKGNSFYFRIDKDNISFLVSDEGQEEGKYYGDNVAIYLKAVIEEYAEKPYAERECIYCKEIIDRIRLAEADRKVLKIFLKQEQEGKKKSNIKYMKVLGIYRDREHLYNYVAGLVSDDREGSWKPGAIRLTFIKECNRLEQAAFVSKENRELIMAMMKKQGVQYLSSGEVDYRVVVEFTAKGEKMYQKILHLRPLYVRKGADRRYEFICSKFQAESYFFKFGKEAKILEPASLAGEFLKRYRAAVKKYEGA